MQVAPGERADARANRQRLIEAARAVFAERGLSAEIKEIAERAGIGVGTVYRNFATKNDLFTAVLTSLVEQVFEAIDRAEDLEDPAQALRSFLVDGFALVGQYGAIVRELAHGGTGGVKLPRELAREQDRRLAELVQRGVDASVFRADLSPTFAAGFILTVLPMGYLDLHRRWPERDIQREMVEMVMRGVLAEE